MHAVMTGSLLHRYRYACDLQAKHSKTVNSCFRVSQANTIVSGSRESQLHQHQKLKPGGTRPVNFVCENCK